MRLTSLLTSFVIASAAVLALGACAPDSDDGADKLTGSPAPEDPNAPASPGDLEPEPADAPEPLAAETDPPKPEEGATDEEIEKGMPMPAAGDYALPPIPAGCTKSQVLTYLPR